MNYANYALTGTPRCREARLMPVLLNWHISDPENCNVTQHDYPKYDDFTLYRISKGVFRKLQNTGFSWQHKVSDFATIPPTNKQNIPTLCIDVEFIFEEARKLVTSRGTKVIHWLKSPSPRALPTLRP